MKKNSKLVFSILLLFSLTLVLTSCQFPLYFDKYNASGTVTDSNGNPIEKAVIKFDNGYDPVYTNSSGKWVKSGLGGTVTISVHKTGYSFSPSEYTVTDDETSLNFVTDNVKTTPYNVSGKITDNIGNKIDNVIIRFSNGAEPVETEEDGTWNKDNLKGEVTVTPEKNGFSFDPSSRTVNGKNSYVNFTAIEATDDIYNISGKIEDSLGNGIGDVILRFSGSYESIKTDSDGTYTKEGLKGEVTVTPEKVNYTFDPTERTVNNSDKFINFIGKTSYSLNGSVTLPNSTKGIPNVTINFNSLDSDNTYTSVTTDSEGNWTKSNLKGKIKIIPVLEGWSISPTEEFVSKENENESIDFTASTTSDYEFYKASGKVIDGTASGVAAVRIDFERDGNIIWTTFTDQSGSFTVGEYLYGTVEVIPQGSYEPTSVTITKETTGIQFKTN